MTPENRRIVLHGLAQLVGVAAGMDRWQRDSLAEEWGDEGPRLSEGVQVIAAPRSLAKQAWRPWSEQELLSQAAYAMRMAARALESYGWRNAELKAHLSERTAPARAKKSENAAAKRLKAMGMKADGAPMWQMIQELEVSEKTIRGYLRAPKPLPEED